MLSEPAPAPTFPEGNLRRQLLRRLMLGLPYDQVRTVRHVMAFPFLRAHVQPQRIVPASSAHREAFWRAALDSIGSGPIEYLEFGVHRGTATRWFVQANRHPESRFYGFDSFEGLPADWKGGMAAGHFDTMGEIPEIDDRRLRFVPGFFNRSLPRFFRDYQPGPGRVVVNFDADLYSSTICAMTWLIATFPDQPMLWLFDEFMNEELSAFETMATAHGLEFDTICASPDFMRVAIAVNGRTGRASPPAREAFLWSWGENGGRGKD